MLWILKYIFVSKKDKMSHCEVYELLVTASRAGLRPFALEAL